MAASLDTLQIAKRLKDAGFDEPQAEAVTGVFRDMRDADFSQLATKADIERLEVKLESEIARLDSRVDLKSAELKAEIIRWFLGVAVAQAALILGMLRLFPGAHP